MDNQIPKFDILAFIEKLADHEPQAPLPLGGVIEAAQDAAQEQVELAMRSKSGRTLHFFAPGNMPYLPITDIPKGEHPASIIQAHLRRHAGYGINLDALRFEGTEDRGGKKVHRFSVKATAGKQLSRPLNELLWIAENPG